MHSNPTTLLLIAQTRTSNLLREAQAARLADEASASGAGTRRTSLRTWLASRLRHPADRLQPGRAELPVYA